jgi:hypothetical protein
MNMSLQSSSINVPGFGVGGGSFMALSGGGQGGGGGMPGLGIAVPGLGLGGDPGRGMDFGMQRNDTVQSNNQNPNLNNRRMSHNSQTSRKIYPQGAESVRGGGGSFHASTQRDSMGTQDIYGNGMYANASMLYQDDTMTYDDGTYTGDIDDGKPRFKALPDWVTRRVSGKWVALFCFVLTTGLALSVLTYNFYLLSQGIVD